MTDKRNGYSLADDLMPIIKGDVALPNFEDMPLSQAVNYAAAWGNVHAARVQFPGAKPYDRPRAIIALETGQYGTDLHGSGIALIEGGYPHGAKAVRFAICKHKKVEHAGADHRRGWYPGHCEICGLNMTYDSGD